MATCMQERLRLDNHINGMLRRSEVARSLLVGTASLSVSAFGISFLDYMYQPVRMPSNVFGAISIAAGGIATASLIGLDYLKGSSEKARNLLRQVCR